MTYTENERYTYMYVYGDFTSIISVSINIAIM